MLEFIDMFKMFEVDLYFGLFKVIVVGVIIIVLI